MPINVIRVDSGRKSNAYGKACHLCNKVIHDDEYVARTKTRGTSFYHCICALSIHLIDNMELNQHDASADTSPRMMSRGLRKKFIFFGN